MMRQFQPFSLLPLVKALSIKSLSISVVLSSSLLMSACVSDKAGTSRIIEEAPDTSTNSSEKTLTLTAALPINNATISAYDLSNDKTLLTASFKKAENLADIPAEDVTNIDKGLAADVTVDSSTTPKRAILLVTLAPITGETSSYYDPVLDQNVSMPVDKPLYALSATNSSGTIGSLNATPYTTLALYRTLARVGWFYDHKNFPTETELATLLKQHPNLSNQYDIALNELENAFNLPNLSFTQLKSFDDLVTLAEANTAEENISPTLSRWLIALAHMKIYQDSFGESASTAPYFSFAHDLATDFYDGDIDGASLKGLADGENATISPSLTTPYIALTDPNATYDDIYSSQKPVLEDYEAKLLAAMKTLTSKLLNASNSDKQAALQEQIDLFLSAFATDDLTLNAEEKATNAETAKNQNVDADPSSYADFLSSNISTIPYVGVGNKSFAVGLPDDINVAKNINSDDSINSPLAIKNIVGKYMGADCQLLLSSNGSVTLTTNGNTYETLVDREINDVLHRIASDTQANPQHYMLNVSSNIENANSRRFIQVEIMNQQVLSASTAITESADQTQLANPEASCVFN